MGCSGCGHRYTPPRQNPQEQSATAGNRRRRGYRLATPRQRVNPLAAPVDLTPVIIEKKEEEK